MMTRSQCPFYQTNAIASQKYDMSSGHMIIIESSGRPWFRGGSVTGLSDTTPDEMIDERTLPPDVANKIKAISKPQKKPPKLRAAAKVESAPANPIFLQASEAIDDPFWKDIFKRMSRNIYRKGFRFFPMSSKRNPNLLSTNSGLTQQRNGSVDSSPNEDENDLGECRQEIVADDDLFKPQCRNMIGRFVYRSKTKEYSVMVSENPEEAFQIVKSFMRQHASLMSEMDQRTLDRIILDFSIDPFDALPKEWSEVKGGGSRSMLITHYSDIVKTRSGLSEAEARDFISTINLGVASGYLGDGNIHMKHGAIENIEGIFKDRETGEFYISIEDAMKCPSTKTNNSSIIGRKTKGQPATKRSTKLLNVYKDYVKHLETVSSEDSELNVDTNNSGNSNENENRRDDDVKIEPSTSTSTLPLSPQSDQQQQQQQPLAKKRGRKKAVLFKLNDKTVGEAESSFANGITKNNKKTFQLTNCIFLSSNSLKPPAPTFIFGSALEAVERYISYVGTGKGKETLIKEDQIFKEFLRESDDADYEDDESLEVDDKRLFKQPFIVTDRNEQTTKLKRSERVSNRLPTPSELALGIKTFSENLIKTNIVSIAAAAVGFVYSAGSLPPSSGVSASAADAATTMSKEVLTKTVKEHIERIECARKISLKFAEEAVYSDCTKLNAINNEEYVKIFCVPEGIRRLFEALVVRTKVFRKIVSNSPIASCHFELIKNGSSEQLYFDDELDEVITRKNKNFIEQNFSNLLSENDPFGCVLINGEDFDQFISNGGKKGTGDEDDEEDDEAVSAAASEDASSPFEDEFSARSSAATAASTPSNLKAVESKNNLRKHKHIVKICDDIVKTTLNFYKKHNSSTENRSYSSESSASGPFGPDSKIIRKTESLTYSNIDRVFKTRKTALDAILASYSVFPSLSDLCAWTLPESPSVLYGGSAAKPGASVKRWWRLVDLVTKKKADVNEPQQRDRK